MSKLTSSSPERVLLDKPLRRTKKGPAVEYVYDHSLAPHEQEGGLTDWYPAGSNPEHEGEYNASQYRNERTLRWWSNKDGWSCMYFANDPEHFKHSARIQRENLKEQALILWRGLSYNPLPAITQGLPLPEPQAETGQ
jgi:hypothetical protein